MTTTQLTPAQHAILAKAINTSEGKLDWFPDNIKGGARKKVLDGMFNRALITPDGDGWCVAAEGYDALGMKRPEITLPATEADAELEADVAAAEASWAKQTKPRSRENSKQAEVIRMLQRPEGATIGQICEATGWQVAAEGYDALGMKRPEVTLPATEADAELEADVAAAEASWAKETKPRSRENSKQAEVIRMLQRPEGATIGQICTATGWQAHTVRGTFAGTFKKKLGLTITSDKAQGGERVYRIA